MDKRKIKVTRLTAVRFSKAAKTYDENAWLQREMWDKLLRQLKLLHLKPKHIVDIGMGTGEHSYGLAKLYSKAYVIGFDIAWGMVKYASVRKRYFPNKPFLLQADLNEIPLKRNSFDLAVSNVVYQRIHKPVEAFLEVKRILRPKGFFCFSLMTKNTLRQLHRSFEAAYKRIKGPSLPEVHEHPTNSAIINSLKKAGFTIIDVMKYKKRPTYKSTYEILEWLKAIGANHHYANWIKGIEGRTILEETDRIYRERFSSDGKIYATFEGLIISARKKD